MQALVHDHTGPIYALYRSYEKKYATAALDAYGLVADETECPPLKAHIESHLKFPLLFCKVIPASRRGM